MAAWRPCLFALASLSAFEPSLAVAGEPAPTCDARDRVLLVQRAISTREGDLHIDSGDALTLLSPSQEARMRQVQDAVTQLHLHFPLALPVKLSPGNMSMQDFMAVGAKILSAFRNDSFVATLHEVIDNTTQAWAEFLGSLQEAAAKLDADCAGDPVENTLGELESFWRAGEAGMSHFHAKAASFGKELVRRQPNEIEAIMEAFPNASNASGDSENLAVIANVSDQGFMDPALAKFTADVLFSNSSKVCSKFQGIWPNLTGLVHVLEEAVSFLEKTNGKRLEEVEGMIEVMAPDVSDKVMGVVNASLAAALNMTSTDLVVTKPALRAIKAELEGCLDCTMPEVAGATCKGPNVLVGLAAALAAWLAFRH